MKIFTKDYLIYLVLLTIFTTIYLLFYNYQSEKEFPLKLIVAIAYGLIVIISTSFFFSRDKYLYTVYALKWGIGLFIIPLTVRYLFILLGDITPFDNIDFIIFFPIIIILLLLFIIARIRSIKNIDKSKLFD